MKIPSEWRVFKFERNIVTAAMKYLSLSSPKFQETRNLQRCVPRNVLKCLTRGKNCRTAGENGSNVMAMEMTFTHIGLFKHKYWNI